MSTINIEIDKPLTVAGYAAALKRSARTVHRWIENSRKGRLSPLTEGDVIRLPGAGILIRPEALDRYLKIKETAKNRERERVVTGQQRLNHEAKKALEKRFS